MFKTKKQQNAVAILRARADDALDDARDAVFAAGEALQALATEANASADRKVELAASIYDAAARDRQAARLAAEEQSRLPVLA